MSGNRQDIPPNTVSVASDGARLLRRDVLGERDYRQLAREGKRPSKDALKGRWRVDDDAVRADPTNRIRLYCKKFTGRFP